MTRKYLTDAVLFVVVLLGLLSLTGAAHAQAGPETSRQFIKMLNAKVDLKDFQNPMNLKDALGLLYEKMEAAGFDLPVLVDAAAFKEGEDSPDIYDAAIKFPSVPRYVTFGVALRIILSQIDDRKPAYVVRQGTIEITTQKRSSITSLLGAEVSLVCERLPIANVIELISEASGVSVVVDPRIEDKLKMPMTLFFRSGVTAEVALRLAAEMAGLKIAVLPSTVYLTDPLNADRLQQEQRNWIVQPNRPGFPGLNNRRFNGDPFSGGKE